MRVLTTMVRRPRTALARLGRDERGATATIVAILLSGGVVMGMLAISVDLGNLTYERRQVQNGADATSLALASTCAADADDCDPADVDVEALLDANAGDDASRYGSPTDAPNGACARGDATVVGDLALHPCESASTDADIADLGECPAIPQWLKDATAIPYVETYAATETAGGADELFLPFSRVLAGGAAGDAGTSACARAAWGAPDGYSGALPLTVSSCEWQEQMDAGGYVENGPIGAKPGYGTGNPWPDASEEVVLWLNTPSEDTHCDWNGHDTAGGFGWLSETDCEAEVSEDDWVQIDTGVNVPSGCKDPLSGLLNTVIDVPVFDCIVGDETLATGEPPTSPKGVCNPDNKAGGGSKTWYHLDGWAKFYISGYVLPGPDGTQLGTRQGTECTNGDKCITGWFLTGALSDAPSIKPPGGDGDYGTYVVKPAG